MSDDQLVSIEENGSYWLSKNSTSYHIIDPKATNLTPIESNGNYSLAKGGSTHYVLDANGNSIRLSSDYITNLLVAGWVPLQVEGGEHFGGFEVLMQSAAWAGTQFGYFSYRFNTSSEHVGNKAAGLARHESWFQFDLDGIGGTIISPGQVSMLTDISGNKHHIDDGHGGNSIILKRDNVTIDPNSSASWNATQVEDSGSGYEVFLSHSSGKFQVWKHDALGNYVSNVNAHLWQHEKTFQADLNGDLTQGLVTIENIGDVHLAIGDNRFIGDTQYYIVDGSNEAIGLTKGSSLIQPSWYANSSWSITQVEDSGSGYEVFLSHSSGKFQVWKHDALGNYVSNVNAHLWQHEKTFQADLNGDLTQGLVTIENIGDVHLAIGDNRFIGDTQYYIVDGSNEAIGLTKGSSLIQPSWYANSSWSITQVEDSGSGYEVFLSHSSGKFQVWKHDALGNYVSNVNAHLWQHEKTFQADLNGDLTQGLVTIENIGDVHLAIGDNRFIGDTQYYIVDGSNEAIGLTKGSSLIQPSWYANSSWSITQVEDSGSGYEVFLSHSSGKFQVWKHDALGNYVSNVNAHLWQHENTFQADLNGDLTQGLVTIENIGDVQLALGDNRSIGDTQYYIVDGSNDPIGLTKGGSLIQGPSSYANASWSMLPKLRTVGPAMKCSGLIAVANFKCGSMMRRATTCRHVNAHLWQHENTFQVDLNGDLTQGLVTIENIGDVQLALGDNRSIGDTQYYIVDGSNDPIGLTKGGSLKGPNSSASWNATQVEDSGTGYEVFWSHSSGKFQVWKHDAAGNYVSHVNAHLWQHENTFQVDLNGDGIDSGNNNIYGSVGNDTFDGGAGDDIINGREGHDTLIGGEGNDWISGDGGSGYAGNDILFGNAGNDDLRGRDGNDRIDGGTGSDTITTGSGLDKIVLRIGDGGNALSDADIITDFTDGSDVLGLDNGLSFGDLTRAQGSGDYANDTIISYGSEYLAILQGIDVSLLTEADFEPVDFA